MKEIDIINPSIVFYKKNLIFLENKSAVERMIFTWWQPDQIHAAEAHGAQQWRPNISYGCEQ